MGTLDWVWNEHVWFPVINGVPKWTWKDIENKPGSSIYFPQISDLNWSLVFGVILIIVRLVLDKIVVEPLGYMLGVTRRQLQPPTPNTVLEKAYKQHTKFNQQLLKNLAKQTDMKVRDIEIWSRRRQRLDAPMPIKKFKDCSWHFIFYGVAFTYGVSVLWHKSWLWKTINCWIDWPTQSVSSDIYWYYMIELAFYWSLVFTLFTDHKRKDFTEMIVHHIATIILIYFSWVMNFVRIGTLVLVVHDAADPWLALAKMCNYCKSSTGKESCFVVFILVWIVSRLWFFPFVVLYSSTIEPYTAGLITTTFFTHWFFNFFLYILMILHLMWSYSIAKIIIRKVTKGSVQDVRSDSDETSDIESDINDVSKDDLTYQNNNHVTFQET